MLYKREVLFSMKFIDVKLCECNCDVGGNKENVVLRFRFYLGVIK